MCTIQHRGRRLPDHLATVGFDHDRTALDCRPLLTTIRQPVEEPATNLADVLMAYIAPPTRLPRTADVPMAHIAPPTRLPHTTDVPMAYIAPPTRLTHTTEVPMAHIAPPAHLPREVEVLMARVADPAGLDRSVVFRASVVIRWSA